MKNRLEATEEQRAKIRSLAQAVLDARAPFPNSTLADLYDVDVMPRQLRKAHQELDKPSTNSTGPTPSPATAIASSTSSASTKNSSLH